MRRTARAAATIVTLSATAAQGAPLIPEGHCAMILASRPTLAGAQAFARGHSAATNGQIYLSGNGWYAVSGGLLETDGAAGILETRKRAGAIPDDAFCTAGHGLRPVYDVRLSTQGGAPDRGTAYVSSPGDGYLNLRRGPGTSHGIIREMSHGAQLRIIGRDGNWRQVRLADGTTGWAYGSNLTGDTPSDAQRRYVSSPGDGYLNLRRGPGTSHGIIRRMDHGSSVWIIERDGNWARLRHEDSGATGWAYVPNLERTAPFVRVDLPPLPDATPPVPRITLPDLMPHETEQELREAFLAFEAIWEGRNTREGGRIENTLHISVPDNPSGMDWCHPRVEVVTRVLRYGRLAAFITSDYHYALENSFEASYYLGPGKSFTPSILTTVLRARYQETSLEKGYVVLPHEDQDGVLQPGVRSVDCQTSLSPGFAGPQDRCALPAYHSWSNREITVRNDAFFDYAEACLRAAGR